MKTWIVAALAVALSGAVGAAAAQQDEVDRLQLLGPDVQDWHLSLDGHRWRIPRGCLMGRLFGGDEEGRRFGTGEEGRLLGAGEEGRRLGAAEDGRRLGADEEERHLGAAEDGRRLGADEEGRRLGAAEEGRRLGADEEGRRLGAAEEGRRLGAAEEGRLHGSAVEPLACRHYSDADVPNAVLVEGVGGRRIVLNPASRYLLEVRHLPASAGGDEDDRLIVIR
ncbi:hypothetical protein [Arenimonas composti]|uniref:Uncharacterized protein n=1 Tax=Arenimonas composti TR7-09 = DSM 18010 TaxID=1121013 RepID=A0A091B6P6_9GAMM|nr:hypothetical protein [Arenimonas composti]KFN47396.1 hypothetical protein P873_01775 [Arenimonas composti TR7-09 = DSM 18010]